jgi:Fe-S-cluster containining protein
MKVDVKLIRDPGGMLSVDVRIHSEDASVQDYLDAYNMFQAECVAPCDGCTNCCWERAPLTAPDVIRYIVAMDAAAEYADDSGNTASFPTSANHTSTSATAIVGSAATRAVAECAATVGSADHASAVAGLAGSAATATTAAAITQAERWLRFIDAHGDIGDPGDGKKNSPQACAEEEVELADISLKRLPEGNCIFLDPDKGCCKAHPLRPLVCQTYVCLPSSPLAEALRRQIVNEGENELVRLLGEAASALPGVWPRLSSSAAADWKTYRARGFAGKKTFAEVLIRDVIYEGLWEKIHQCCNTSATQR